MEANAAQIEIPIHNGDVLAHLGGFNRGMVSCRSAADYQEVVVVLGLFHKDYITPKCFRRASFLKRAVARSGMLMYSQRHDHPGPGWLRSPRRLQ